MKIWILGAKGQLGRAVTDRCQAMGIAFKASGREEVDITNRKKLTLECKDAGLTHIINCAAYTNVDLAENESKKAYAVNALGAENLALLAKEQGLYFTHVSTDYVFDGGKDTPYHEADTPNPLSVYGKSKWEGELRVQEVLPSACIVRTSWIFGHLGKNFISTLLHKLKSETEIFATDEQINRPTYNRDLATALIDLCCHSGVFHFANEGPLSRYQIARDFFSEAKKRELPIRCQNISAMNPEDVVALSPRPRYSVLDTEKVSLALGRKPRLWETILKDYFDETTPHH